MASDTPATPNPPAGRWGGLPGKLSLAAVGVVAVIGAADQVYKSLKSSEVISDLRSIVAARGAKPETGYRLVLENGSTMNNPSDQDLRNAVTLVSTRSEAFLVLERNADEFMQSTISRDGKRVLEWRSKPAGKNSGGVLFACDGDIDEKILVQTLIDYRQDKADWVEVCRWKRVNL